MKNWLDKYQDGGPIQPNYNDASVSMGPNFVGDGYDTIGRDYSPAWGGQFQNGGNLWNTDKKAFVDSTLNANKNLDFVHRLYDPSAGSIQVPNESGRSTHLMANDKTRVYPEVVNINGHLQHLSGDAAWDYADSNKQYIDFKTPEQADWFASSRDKTSGYKMGTNVLSKIDPKTGKPKMQMGGALPGATGMMYARTQDPAPSNGSYAKKTKASAQDGKDIQKKRYNELYAPIENKVFDIVKTQDDYDKLPYSTQSFLDKTIAGFSVASNRNIPPMDPIINEVQNKIQKLPKEELTKLLNTNWSNIGIAGAMKNTPSSVSYLDMLKYVNHFNDLKKKGYTLEKGGVIKDDMGQWAHPGEITEIGSNDITMQGVNYPVLGVSDTGDTQMMYPDQDYKFDGEKVTEYPIAQNGDWLSKYDNISATSPLKKQAEESIAKRNANRPTISQYTPKPGEQAKFDKQKLQRIAEDNAPLNRMAASKGAENMQDAIEAAMIMEGGMAAGKLVGKGAKAAGKYITEETALKNAYKLNPYAFKPDPEAYYRTLGKEGIDDAFGSGVIRPKQYHNKYSPDLGKRIDVNEPEFPEGSYFNKSGIYSSDKLYNPDYIAEVKGKDELFTYPERVVFNENIRVAQKDIPIEQANFYKKDWLKRYKEVPKPTSTQRVIRGPINYWEEPKFSNRNPNFNPEAYANSPIGNPSASRDIPKGMEPRLSKDKNGGWLNRYK